LNKIVAFVTYFHQLQGERISTLVSGEQLYRLTFALAPSREWMFCQEGTLILCSDEKERLSLHSLSIHQPHEEAMTADKQSQTCVPEMP